MLQIYGSPMSSARRCFWVLEELELPYQRVALDMSKKEHKAASYTKLNPNGKVPCLVDGSFVIWESMAINFYLCEKYGRQLLGKTAEENGLIQQWTFWGIAELQRPLIEAFIQLIFVPEDKRDMSIVERGKKAAEPLLHVLDQYLTAKTFLVGNRFTLADLNLASVVHINHMMQNDISAHKNVSEWLRDCTSRPAFKKVADLGR